MAIPHYVVTVLDSASGVSLKFSVKKQFSWQSFGRWIVLLAHLF